MPNFSANQPNLIALVSGNPNEQNLRHNKKSSLQHGWRFALEVYLEKLKRSYALNKFYLKKAIHELRTNEDI